MFMVNNLIGFGARVKPRIQTPVTFSGGSVFGNGTGGGGNAAAIDGNNNQAAVASARGGNATLLYVGYTFAAGKVFSGFRAWGANNHGFIENENNSTTINCRASNGAAPTNATEAQSNGVLLGSVTFTDTADATVRENLVLGNAVAYTSIWLTVPAAVGSNTSQIAEMLFFEDL